MVGSLEDISSAVVRRGYRLDIQNPDKIQMLYDRPPDVVLRKIARVREPAKWLRAWMAPFSYQDKPVFLAQVGRRRGGHTEAIVETDIVLSNRSDEARNLFVQDMVYSSGLKKIAFVGSAATTEAGVAPGRLPGAGIQGADGLRAVLFVVSRPLSMSDLEFLDWNHYLQKSVIDATEKTENVGN